MRASSGDNNMPGTLIQVTAAASVNAVGCRLFSDIRHLEEFHGETVYFALGQLPGFNEHHMPMAFWQFLQKHDLQEFSPGPNGEVLFLDHETNPSCA